MGIIETVASIPTNANLSLRLKDAEAKIEAQQLEIEAQQLEIEALHIRLAESEQQKRALESQIEQNLIESHSDSLSDVQENILSGFIENERLSPEMIADVLDIKSALASYHLNVLHKKDYVIELSVNENQVFWGITQTGREYLFSHGLFS